MNGIEINIEVETFINSLMTKINKIIESDYYGMTQYIYILQKIEKLIDNEVETFKVSLIRKINKIIMDDLIALDKQRKM